MTGIVPEDQRVGPEVGELAGVEGAPTRVFVKAHSNVFGMEPGEAGWIVNDEEAVEAVRLGFISFASESDFLTTDEVRKKYPELS